MLRTCHGGLSTASFSRCAIAAFWVTPNSAILQACRFFSFTVGEVRD